jgi:HSP20 family protein
MWPEDAFPKPAWQPRADVYRGRHGWLVKLELAGVRVEDVHLTLAGRRIIVEGVRRDFSIREGQRTYSMEIAYNRFERAIDLPCDVEKARIVTEYRDGMLLILLHMGREEK